MRKSLPLMGRLTLWRVIFAALGLAFLYVLYLRVRYGLGGCTNLSDQFPWGLWIGFDVLCGVGLAAGGFTLVATVHIFNLERYRPVLRPAILTAFLGYLLVILALMFDLGRPDRIWHPIVMWNPHSVMFEVAWCVTLYTTVLFLEFLPVVFEKFGFQKPLEWLKLISVPLMVAGILLSTLHQSSLGSLYLIVPNRLDPAWYSPFLPVFFFVSAIGVGLAMTIFESWHSSRAFQRQLELPLLNGLARVLAVVSLLYLTMRCIDINHRGAVLGLFENRLENWLFWLEIALLLVPTLMLFRASVRRSTDALYAAAVLWILGFIANRLNVAITGLEKSSGAHYVPKWTEVVVTLFICALGFAAFRIAAQYFPIFGEHRESGAAGRSSAEIPSGVHEVVVRYRGAPSDANL
jgi:Ni/Fe-hydrogenase subunit HybB-like protein